MSDIFQIADMEDLQALEEEGGLMLPISEAIDRLAARIVDLRDNHPEVSHSLLLKELYAATAASLEGQTMWRAIPQK